MVSPPSSKHDTARPLLDPNHQILSHSYLYFSNSTTFLFNPNHFASQLQPAASLSFVSSCGFSSKMMAWKSNRGTQGRRLSHTRWSASKQLHNPEKRLDNWRRSYQLRRKVFDFDLSKKHVDSLQVVKSSNFNKYNSPCCDILIVLLQSIY